MGLNQEDLVLSALSIDWLLVEGQELADAGAITSDDFDYIKALLKRVQTLAALIRDGEDRDQELRLVGRLLMGFVKEYLDEDGASGG